MKLCLDPGHGRDNRGVGRGYDPGACAAGLCEADIVLQWGLTGKFVLTQLGIAVVMTRDDDLDIAPVGQRDEFAERKGASHFLSIHCNSASPSATGTETFYRDSADEAWAQKVQNAALHALGLRDRGLKLEGASQHSRLAVFDFDGPAALVELGFITNSRDRAKMLSRDVRIAFWQKLAEELL